MKKLLALSLLTLLCISGFAQTVTLTFIGVDANYNYCKLNRVVIVNKTKSWQETIYYPDTTLTMQVGTGIEDYAVGDVFTLSQNNPNPFNGTTEANLTIVESGDVSMEISDVNGRIVETQNFASLQTGNHRFRIQVSAAGIYFMTARQRGQSSTIKMINNGNGTENAVEYVGIENTKQLLTCAKGNSKGSTNNPFSIGDQLEYVGYATFNGTEVESDRIQQMQGASQTFTLHFNQAQLPTVTTSAVTNIGLTSATCGGNVTDDGGYSILSRGICWSTQPNPVFNDNHTTDGSGTGSFSSNITGLSFGTTYYVRAYAESSVGIVYGNEVSFATAINGPPCPNAATLTDVEGNVYNTVQIGNQCWMKENLRTTKYPDSTTIPMGNTYSSSVAYRYYPNNDSSNVTTYGYLYNWPAVMHNSSSSSSNPSGVQGICPHGWHVPSYAEWTQLANYVSSQSEYVCGSNSTSIAKALASTTGWSSSTVTCAVGNNPSTNNTTGFTALPAGNDDGSYYNFGDFAVFWSATQVNALIANYICLYYNFSNVVVYDPSKSYGFSVRCVRD